MGLVCVPHLQVANAVNNELHSPFLLASVATRSASQADVTAHDAHVRGGLEANEQSGRRANRPSCLQALFY